MLINKKQYTQKKEKCRWGSYYLVSSLIAVMSSSIGAVSADSYSLAMAVYITGLITQRQAQTTLISEQIGLVSHDQLSRMLAVVGWTISIGAINVVKLLECLGLKDGYLIIDDVLIAKPFAKLIAFTGWDWDHTRRCNVFGQRLVFVVWSNGYLLIPLLFAFWQKDPDKVRRRKRRGRPAKRGRPITDYSKAAQARRKQYRRKRKLKLSRKRLANGVHYRSKNELARVLVWKLKRAGIKCNFILFDNWYASEENLSLFERLQLFWVSRVKDNAKVYFNAQRLSVKEVANSVKKDNYHYYDTVRARVRSFNVLMNQHLRKLTVIKNDSAPESGRIKYLLTNATHLTNLEHVFWYRNRWAIEVFFRDCKQFLNLTSCEARNDKIIVAHVLLVCIAYTFMQLLKPLAFKHRPSIGCSIKTFAPLLLDVDSLLFAKPLANGSFQLTDFDQIISVFRTAFSNIPSPENPLFS